MTNIHVLDVSKVHAEIVINDLNEQSKEIDEIFVVTKLKSGQWLLSVSGDLNGVCRAHSILLSHALENMRGE